MVIKLFVSSTSGNVLMKLHQRHIMSILDCKQIAYETVDVADPHRREEKLWMQSQLNLSDSDLTALPPQIFNGDTHRGDYSTFFTAVECEALFGYLDLTPPPDEVEAQLENGVLDILTPSPEELEKLNAMRAQMEQEKQELTEVVTETIAHHPSLPDLSPPQPQPQPQHRPAETAL